MGHQPHEYRLIALWHASSYAYYVMDLQRQAAQDGAPLDAVYWDDKGSGRWVTGSEIKEATARARLGLTPLTGADRPFKEQVIDFDPKVAPSVFFATDTESEETNATRATRAAHALIAYTRLNNSEEDISTVVGDFLSDLRHLCDGHGLDFDALNHTGSRHHAYESNAARFKE